MICFRRIQYARDNTTVLSVFVIRPRHWYLTDKTVLYQWLNFINRKRGEGGGGSEKKKREKNLHKSRWFPLYTIKSKITYNNDDDRDRQPIFVSFLTNTIRSNKNTNFKFSFLKSAARKSLLQKIFEALRLCLFRAMKWVLEFQCPKEMCSPDSTERFSYKWLSVTRKRPPAS